MWLLINTHLKTERQLLMTLRNGTISKGHLQHPRRCLPRQIPSPTGTEAGAFYYKVTAIFSACSLLMSVVLTSPTEQNSLITAPKFPSEVAKPLRIPQRDFNKIPKQCTEFPFPNIVYFSNNGSSSPCISTSNKIWRSTFFTPSNSHGFIFLNSTTQQWNNWHVHTLHSHIILQTS